jgi:hypothetical protein
MRASAWPISYLPPHRLPILAAHAGAIALRLDRDGQPKLCDTSRRHTGINRLRNDPADDSGPSWLPR